MTYLKERYSFANDIVLSTLREGERADSVHDGWICFYEIAFKIGLRFLFHRIIDMVEGDLLGADPCLMRQGEGDMSGV
ncbi:hypothetical protein FNV43_RR00032 [Rhamnella rubrinervis]|uniref:Uncharacterized protein n=1 Tax=Rhamnella rubrinervis TaxID=2594499 RepID=A0A8K0MR20_9ROSA|nr:hypothetical protein FNV43_RR00032 [Rhamnella rubrinervis]